MGIEPLLFLAALVLGFALQAFIALRDGARERLRAGRWMAWLTSEWARNHGLEEHSGSFEGAVGGRRVVLNTERLWVRPTARRILQTTGVRHRFMRRHIPVGVPNTVLWVGLREPLDARFRAVARSDAPGTPTGHPILDQQVRIDAEAPTEVAALLACPEVRDPLLELLGRHPLSVVTESGIALCVAGDVRHFEPLTELVSELALALETVSRPAEALQDRASNTTRTPFRGRSVTAGTRSGA
jgi:hypothetical protein